MRYFRDLSIYKKILAVSLSAVFLLGFLSELVIWDSLGDLMVQQLERRGTEIGNHIAALTANSILVDDGYSLHELIHETKQNTEDVRYILIADHQGRILAHTFPGSLPKGLRELNSSPLQSGARVVSFDSDEGPIRDILVPIEGGTVGYVRIGITEAATRTIIDRTLQKFVMIILGVCFLAMLFTAKLARLITAPISKLVQVSQAIAEGRLSVKAEIGSNDEIGKLASSFNEMAASLAATNNERDALVETLREKEALRSTLLSKVITAQEDERRRISRELHDETGQALTWLVISMRALADKASDDRQRELLMNARDVAADILGGIREMAVELRPPVLDDLGLVAAMRKYVASFQERFDISVNFSAESEIAVVDKQPAVALYRIMQEALTNIVKHSEATAVDIAIQQDLAQIRMKITDNGRGVLEEELDQARKENRLGIYGMKERAELLGGSFCMQSTTLTGTTIEVAIPYQNGEIS